MASQYLIRASATPCSYRAGALSHSLIELHLRWFKDKILWTITFYTYTKYQHFTDIWFIETIVSINGFCSADCQKPFTL